MSSSRIHRPSTIQAGSWLVTGAHWFWMIGLVWGLAGCAALTNPVADGMPVRMLPPELLAESRDSQVMIPLAWLRRPPEVEYRLAAGDVLGVYIDGVLGTRDTLPPVTLPDASGLPPAVGIPITVRADGTLPLPLIQPIPVVGKTLDEVEALIVDAFAVKRKIVRVDSDRVLVSLIRPRTERILVIRQDNPQGSPQSENKLGTAFRGLSTMSTTGTTPHQGSGTEVEMPSGESDVLTALTRTGGLPGAGAVNEVVIQRGASLTPVGGVPEPLRITRIPLRVNPGEPPPFAPEDVILKTGDIVLVEARLAEVYYTGGLMPAREIPLPRDVDITAVEAIVRAGGPLVNGGLSANNLSGQIVAKGIGHPSPSLLSVLRRTPDGRQVNIRVDLHRALRDPRENIIIEPGDMLILQETPGEAMSRYATNVVTLNFITDLFRTSTSVGTAGAVLPGQ